LHINVVRVIQLFKVGFKVRFTSYLRYLYLFVHMGVQHILCCVFLLFFFVLCTLCCQFLWMIHFWLLLRHSLTCISNIFFSKLKVWYIPGLELCGMFRIAVCKSDLIVVCWCSKLRILLSNVCIYCCMLASTKQGEQISNGQFLRNFLLIVH